MKKNDTYNDVKIFNQEVSDAEKIEEFENHNDKIGKRSKTKIEGVKVGPIRLDLKITPNENEARDAITNKSAFIFIHQWKKRGSQEKWYKYRHENHNWITLKFCT